jgi:hypothetical protein
MTALYEAAFGLANLYPMPFWVLMIVAPHWGWTRRVVSSLWIFAPLAIVYTALLILSIISPAANAPALDLAALGTPQGIAALLGTPEGATVGWIHFLAFDLFVGRWIYLDSRERGLNAFLVAPTLFLTLMAGPFGLLLYLLLRLIQRTPSQKK